MPQQIINGVGKAGFRVSTGASVSNDTDAQAFLTAAGITDTTQVNAVKELVLDLKAAGVWTKMKALYPMVGGTATTHKFNLKDPRDVDEAYRLSFVGGWTHTSNGVQPSAALNGYANTFISPSTRLTLNNVHLSAYARTNSIWDGDMGVLGAHPTYYTLSLGAARFACYDGLNNSDSPRANPDPTSSLGLIMGTRTTSNNAKLYFNGVIRASNGNNSIGVQPSGNIFLGATNGIAAGTPNGLYSKTNKQYAFFSIGDGLTDLESNLFYQIVEKFQYALGRNVNANRTFYFNRNYSNETNAFIFNGAISDATQQSAINTLVNDLKAAGIWTKMKAVYPMVGGTALAHKFNLANPVDTDAAYRLRFFGGWTHSSTGALPNGTDGYANTNLVPSAAGLSLNSTHISYYSRTNVSNNGYEMGCASLTSEAQYLLLICRHSSGLMYSPINVGQSAVNSTSGTNTISTGLFIGSRTLSNAISGFRDNTKIVTSSAVASSLPFHSVFIGATSNYGNPGSFSNKQCAFASIGDGLTDLESNLFYQIVEKFQYTLGRNINTSQPFYYNSSYTNETNAFIFNGAVTDTTQISAVNTLVTTLKTAGIWTKMKAVYPMVGGTATAHKFNLVNPIDSTSAYALSFNGGWIHSSTGALPNGSNAYADTFLAANTMAQNSTHFSFYSRTNRAGSGNVIMGYQTGTQVSLIYPRYTDNNTYIAVNRDAGVSSLITAVTNTTGLYVANRTSSTNTILYKNNIISSTNSSTSIAPPSISYYLGTARNLSLYDNLQCAFSSIGDGLTDAEATTFYNAVQAFQTTLGRQV